jgi:hypothetical protein
VFNLLSNYVLRHEDVWGNGGIAPSFLTSSLMEVSDQFLAQAALPSSANWIK